MKYVAIFIVLLPSLYLLSFAKYSWNNNKLSSIGSVILAIISVVLPSVVILTR